MARDPSPDLLLTPLQGKARTIGQLLTTFHLLFVALDPFTHESSWILPTAARILQNFEQADCRIAWLVTGAEDECRQFLGPWASRIMTFADPQRSAVKEFGLERLPALVHVGMPRQGPKAQFLVAIQRCLVPQPPVIRIRILVEVVVVGIQDQLMVADVHGHRPPPLVSPLVSWLVSPAPARMRPTT